MKEIKLNIEGMHCNGCANRLEKIINNIDGVKSSKVDFEKKIAIVIYEEEKTNINSIQEEIEDAGFKGSIC